MSRTTASSFGRSVMDYVTTSELDQALKQQSSSSSTIATSKATKQEEEQEKDNDWTLPIADPENCVEPQSADMELQRLLTLKSYMLLDADKEQAFDQLTMEAREVFGVPTSLISLIDLGRQFLFSNTGADVRETTRQVAFCAYTIQSKHDVTVIPDASQDFRFQNGPLVQSGPKLRFYAGAPLISPEGYKLGTFCVEGPVPRPQGLNEDEKQKLKEYAAKTMELMVERRKKLRDVLVHNSSHVSIELRQHAAVATSLGDYAYEHAGDLVTAMRLYQESVQTIMHAEPDTTTKNNSSSTTPPTAAAAADNADNVEPGETTSPPRPAPPTAERQKAMAQLLMLLSVGNNNNNNNNNKSDISETTKKELMAKVVALYEQPKHATTTTTTTTSTTASSNMITDHGIAGLFHVPPKLKGLVSDPQPLPALFFNEVFKIDLRDCLPGWTLPPAAAAAEAAVAGTEDSQQQQPLVVTPFTVPIEECSKATLFNMGQIHYHWHNPETAMQFFHLAASVSHKISPLEFDPIDISCINNMAQIHLQYGQSDDAMKMLTETLERGNRALAAMYRQTEAENELLAAKVGKTTKETPTATTAGATTILTTDEDNNNDNIDVEDDEYDYGATEEISAELEKRDIFRTCRLRRKLARTLINIAHVHFFNCNYNESMASLKGAIPLLDAEAMTGRTLAAIWYNMSLVFYHQGGEGMLQEALVHLDKFLELATKLNGPDHLQNANALYRKARILVEMGNANAAMEPIEEALRIRKLKLGSKADDHVSIAEALCLKGKILLSRKECNAALDSLNTCLEIQRKQQLKNGGEDLTFEMAQTLLDIGQALHILGQFDASLEKYMAVLEWTRKFFGAKHPFVARVAGIIANIYVQVGKMEESQPFLAEAATIQQELQKASVGGATTTTN